MNPAGGPEGPVESSSEREFAAQLVDACRREQISASTLASAHPVTAPGESGGRIWQVSDACGRRVFAAKVFGSGRGFDQAWTAHRKWVGPAGVGLPLRGVLRELRALLFDWTDLHWGGDPADRDAALALGDRVGRLHTQPAIDDDPMRLPEACVRRTQMLLRRMEENAELVAEFGAPSQFGVGLRLDDDQRVPTHRDLRRDNWGWQGGRVVLIDFEHARLDGAAVDLAELWMRWSPTPIWEDFLTGYGRHRRLPTEGDLRVWGRISCLGTLLHPVVPLERRMLAMRRLHTLA